MKLSKTICIAIICILVINCKKDDDPVVNIPIEETTIEEQVAENAPPTSPILVLPEKNSNLNSLVPILQWEASTDPENENIQYDVFVGTNESSLTIIASNVETTGYEITADLEKGTTYYWNVVAKDTKENSTSSELFNFSTEYIAVNLVTQDAAFSKRNFSTTTVFNNKIWVIGGKDESGTILSDIWSSTDGHNWTLETNTAPFGTIEAHNIVVFKEKMWLYGGTNGTRNSKIWSTLDGVNWVQETNDSPWNITPFSSYRSTTFFVLDNKIWRFAGYDSSTGDLTEERYIWNSSDGKNWTLVSENHGFDKKYGMEVIPFQGKLIGIEGNTIGSDKFTKIRQSSDGINWEVIAENLPFSFGYYSEAQILNDKLYITAGSGYSELWFTEDGITWQQAIQEKKYPSRYANATVVFQNKIYIVGGGTHTDAYNDVWTLE